MKNYKSFYIDGAFIDASDREAVSVINPATERVAGEIALGTEADVDRAVRAARTAFTTFAKTSREDRLALLGSVLETYMSRRRELADALVEEIGAPSDFAFDTQAGAGALHLQTAIEALRTYQFERNEGGSW